MPHKSGNCEKIREILKKKRFPISAREIQAKLKQIEESQLLFPETVEQANLVQLLTLYERSAKKVLILLEELDKKQLPVTITLSVLGEDWRGMANAILGIVHQKEGNVLYLKALTARINQKLVAILLLSFVLNSPEEYSRFLAERNHLIGMIREASVGSQSQTLLLEDETIKFELYNQTLKRIHRIYKGEDVLHITGENGEALKFFSSRSREYLGDRKISDLAEIIIDSYRFQRMVETNQSERMIRIKNIETKYERLTGITFVCWKNHFSVENFLNTLEFIVPGHVIKHHKSFTNKNGVLVYRLEIVDNEGNPLNPQMIKGIQNSLDKQICTIAKESFSQVKSIGGFEHYARAIIPFLMEELNNTEIPQVFLNVDQKNEFFLEMKVILVHYPTKKTNLNRLVNLLENKKGIEIYSVIPPRIYKNRVEVNILHFKVTISEFTSIPDVFSEIRSILKQVFGQIRDFDVGLREKDLQSLNELKTMISSISPQLLREIYYNFDEIYRMETPVSILSEIISLCRETIQAANRFPPNQIVINFTNVFYPHPKRKSKTVFIISTTKVKKEFSVFLNHFHDTQIYFTRFEWNQRAYLIIILKKKDEALSPSEIMTILNFFQSKNPGKIHFVEKESEKTANRTVSD